MSAVDFNEFDKRYVLKADPEYQKLLRDVHDMKDELRDTKKSSWRVERYLVGGIDDNGKYTLGLSAWVKFLTFAIVAFLTLWPLLIHYRVIQ